MDELIAVSSMEHAELAEFVDGMSTRIGVPIRLSRWSTAELAERPRRDDTGPWDLLLGTAATVLHDPTIVGQLAPLDRIDFAGLPPNAVAANRRWFSPSRSYRCSATTRWRSPNADWPRRRSGTRWRRSTGASVSRCSIRRDPAPTICT